MIDKIVFSNYKAFQEEQELEVIPKRLAFQPIIGFVVACREYFTYGYHFSCFCYQGCDIS